MKKINQLENTSRVLMILILSIIVIVTCESMSKQTRAQELSKIPMDSMVVPLDPASIARAQKKSEMSHLYAKYKEEGNYEMMIRILNKVYGEDQERDAKIRREYMNPSKAERTTFNLQSAHTINVVQYPQETAYYCCPAACKSVIRVKNSNPPSQNTLASLLGTNTQGTGFGPSIPATLNRYITTVGAYELKYFTNINDIRSNIHMTIDGNFALVANGLSELDNSYLPNYPKRQVYHYIAVRGYDSNNIYIVDPAANTGLSEMWEFSKVVPYYSVNERKFMDFVSPRGIIF